MAAALEDIITQRHSDFSEATLGALSDREFAVLQSIGQGPPGQQVGQRRNWRAKVVGTCRQHIIRKLKLQTGPELIRQAVGRTTAEQLV